MKQSGTKLVVGLACLALAAGLVSWWYRYTTAHQATTFWGSEAASLIAQPSQVEFFRLRLADSSGDSSEEALRIAQQKTYETIRVRELTQERGMVHLRHALMSDRNYVWVDRPNPEDIDWQWCFRFHDEGRQAQVVLSEDLSTLGLVVEENAKHARTVSCQPMAETLLHYFRDIGLLPASTLE